MTSPLSPPPRRGLSQPLGLFLAWAPLALYSLAIYALSARPAAPLPLAFPGLDKIVHAVEYFILAALAARALRSTWPHLPLRRVLLLATLFAALYAAADEFHQLCVPGRTPDLADLVADVVGAAAAAACFRAAATPREAG